MKFQQILFSLLGFTLTALSLSTHAENIVMSDCTLKGLIVLEAPTQVICLHDLTVEDGTLIVTKGFPLDVLVVGNMNLTPKTDDPHWSIQKSDSASELNPSAAGPISILARTGSGKLVIDNGEGPVHIELTSAVPDYEQTVHVAAGTPVETWLNGEDLTLVGSDHHLPVN